MNKAFLIGRVYNDQQSKQVNDTSINRFILKVERETTQVNDFLMIEYLGQPLDYIAKTNIVAVYGELRRNTWNNLDGSKKEEYLIRASRIEFLTAGA